MNEAGHGAEERRPATKPERISVPIDIARCPIEVFSVVNGLASRRGLQVTLLHVVHLNIFPLEGRIYGELIQESRSHLERLAREYLDPNLSVLLRVRGWNPAEEIAREAKADGVGLIVLATHGPSLWRRVRCFWRSSSSPVISRLAEKIVRKSACGVFVVYARGRFDCERAWGRPMSEKTAAEAWVGDRSPIRCMGRERHAGRSWHPSQGLTEA